MDKFSLLSREQETKKVFFQLGKKFNLPLDIIINNAGILKHDEFKKINYEVMILFKLDFSASFFKLRFNIIGFRF